MFCESKSTTNAPATVLMSISRRLETLNHAVLRVSPVAETPRGIMIPFKTSPGKSAVLRYAMKNSLTGNARSPVAEANTTFASSASRHGALSPIGEAVTMLPPIVARLRIWREPNTRSMSPSIGNSSPS